MKQIEHENCFKLFLLHSLLTFGCLFSSTIVVAAKDSPVCEEASNKSWQIKYLGAIIGNQTYGFRDKNDCSKALANKNENLLCSWNGYAYQFFNFEKNIPLGTEVLQNHYSQLDDCIKVISLQPKSEKLACGWNGKYYSPRNKLTNLELNAAENGFTLEGCMNTVKQATPFSVCSWDYGSYLYDFEGKKLSQKYASHEKCLEEQKYLYLAKDKEKKVIEILKDIYIDHKIENPTKTFDGLPADEKVGFPWTTCGFAEAKYHLIMHKDGVLLPQCAPDSLYSWGGMDKLAWFFENLNSNKEWPVLLSRSLYTTASPSGTFGYGDFPLRFKIKKGTIFKVYGGDKYQCHEFPKADQKNTVIMRYVDRGELSFLDYIICNTNVIESWSFGQKEHYDEVFKDMSWISSKSYFLWEAYSKNNGVDVYLNNNLDNTYYGTDFSVDSLYKRMHILKRFAQENLGDIFVRPGSEDLKQEHFKPNTPTYFNPN